MSDRSAQRKAAEELIKAGANFKVRLNLGFTPYLIAVREGQLRMVRALLKAGVDVNETISSASGGRFGGGSKAIRAGAANEFEGTTTPIAPPRVLRAPDVCDTSIRALTRVLMLRLAHGRDHSKNDGPGDGPVM